MAAIQHKKLELVVYGFVKDIDVLCEIPNVIKDLIIEFAKFCFNWKNSKHGDGYTFNDEEPTKLAAPENWWSFLAINDVISSDICDRFEWGLTFKQEGSDFFAFMFGVVKHPRDESIKKWNYGWFGEDKTTKSKQFGCCINNHLDAVRIYGGPPETEYDEFGKIEWKESNNEGKIVLIVDFVTNEIRLVYNDKDLGVVFQNVPDKVVPAVTIHSCKELVCTKYKFFA